MKPKRIVITGGPGTGKTTIINQLIELGYSCAEEISRQVTLEAKKKGIDQLFLTDPVLFSDLLLKGRIKQFEDATLDDNNIVFLDRGIPDVVAYMDYIGTDYPNRFIEACHTYKYDLAFVLAPWQDIFISDNERYENFDQAVQIHDNLLTTYSKFGYQLIDVPFGSVRKRTEFILKNSNAL